MIYRIDSESGDIREPLDWKLYSADRRRVALKSEAELREFLKGHPDQGFFLVAGAFMKREIQGESAKTFDSRGEHIRCGIVRYDSAIDKIVTRTGIKVEYSENSKRSNAIPALLQQATKRLEEVLGPSAAWVMVRWDQHGNGNGRSHFTLWISDWTGEVSSSFSSEELRSYSQERYPWLRIWGDLLQVRSHKQLEAVTGAAED